MDEYDQEFNKAEMTFSLVQIAWSFIKSLYRHTKICDSKLPSAQRRRQSCQSEGQTALLLGKFKHDELLQKELFPDGVSLTVNKDPLICNYSYIKGRWSKGNLDFVRTSVRNLAKLLQLSKKSDNNIKDLADLLRPTLFKLEELIL